MLLLQSDNNKRKQRTSYINRLEGKAVWKTLIPNPCRSMDTPTMALYCVRFIQANVGSIWGLNLGCDWLVSPGHEHALIRYFTVHQQCCSPLGFVLVYSIASQTMAQGKERGDQRVYFLVPYNKGWNPIPLVICCPIFIWSMNSTDVQFLHIAPLINSLSAFN